MTRSEKRYFKLYRSGLGIKEDSIYVRLFDLINKQETYAEEELRKVIGDAEEMSPISSQKKYLFEVILKSMRAFHQEKSRRAKLSEYLWDAEYLLQKGLLKEAKKSLLKARKNAIKFEFFGAQLEIMEVERKLIKQTQGPKIEEEIQDLFAREDKLLEELNEWTAYYQPYDLALISSFRGMNAMNAPFINDSELPHGFRSRSFFHRIKAIEASQAGKSMQAFNHFREEVEHWDKNPSWKSEFPAMYKVILSNFLHACHQTEQYAEFPKVLSALKSLPGGSPRESAHDFQHLSLNELVFLLNTDALEEAGNMVNKIEKGFKTYSAHLKPNLCQGIFFNLINVFFFLEKFQQALHWMYQLEAETKAIPNTPYRKWMRIMEPILHLELENTELLESKLLSWGRYLRKKPCKFEDGVRMQILKLHHSTERLQDTAILQSFYSYLMDPEFSSETGKRELSIWLTSHLQNTSIRTEFSRILQTQQD